MKESEGQRTKQKWRRSQETEKKRKVDLSVKRRGGIQQENHPFPKKKRRRRRSS